jgi:hypothetical protein
VYACGARLADDIEVMGLSIQVALAHWVPGPLGAKVLWVPVPLGAKRQGIESRIPLNETLPVAAGFVSPRFIAVPRNIQKQISRPGITYITHVPHQRPHQNPQQGSA